MFLFMVHTGSGRNPSEFIGSGFLLQARLVPIRRDQFSQHDRHHWVQVVVHVPASDSEVSLVDHPSRLS